MRSTARLLAALLLVWAAACRLPVDLDDLYTDTRIVSVDELPQEFDSTRTYHHRLPGVDADSVWSALRAAGIPVRTGWEPLESGCADPIGPLFTVELRRPDARMEGLDFERGPGRLFCATRLRRYTLRR